MMNMVGLNFQLPIVKQIWLFKDLNTPKKIKINMSRFNEECNLWFCNVHYNFPYLLALIHANNCTILILMLNFWISTSRKFWFENGAMCNVVQQSITPKPLINYQSLDSTITTPKSQHLIRKIFQNLANGGLP